MWHQSKKNRGHENFRLQEGKKLGGDMWCKNLGKNKQIDIFSIRVGKLET
jgi:hypothetical protein